MGVDTLSDVLRAVRLTGAVYFNVDAVAPWVAEAPPGSAIASSIVPGAEHLIPYHVVTEGSCFGSLVDGEAVRLETGDVIVFPHGDPHVMSSEPRMRAAPHLPLYQRPSDRPLPIAITAGRGGPVCAHLVCGFLGCTLRPFNPLIATLPRVLVVSARDAGAGWLKEFVTVAATESSAPRMGGEAMLARLSELLFVEVVRRYVEKLPPGQTGWLAGLRDEQVGRALALLHARPAHDWTLDALAKEVAMSRSAFAERFTGFVGQPPMQYLARWRMQLASSLLARGGATIAAIASEVGYESEAAFSRAFKKLVGVSPSAWRQRS